MCAFLKDKNIDMLSYENIRTLICYALTYLFTTLEHGIFFSLFDEKNPAKAEELATVLRNFYVVVRTNLRTVL